MVFIEYKDCLGNVLKYSTDSEKVAHSLVRNALDHADAHNISWDKIGLKVIRIYDNFTSYTFPIIQQNRLKITSMSIFLHNN
jgi:hypothetical protein